MRWNKFDDAAEDNLTETAFAIIKTLHGVRASLDKKDIGRQTNRIKYELIKLGYGLGNCVYANLKKYRNIQYKEIQKLVGRINSFVCSNQHGHNFGKHRFRNTEWMYDIHWYKDVPEEHYMPSELVLAVESEMGNNRYVSYGEMSQMPYSSVKYDFQKLLATNACLRLMIFRVASEDYLCHGKDCLDEYFRNAIKHYTHLREGDQFLFACYIKQDLYYKLLTK